MGNQQLASAWRVSGNNFIASNRYEEALRCFQKALELDPRISVAFRNKAEMEKFIREGGSERLKEQEAIRRRQHEAMRQYEIEETRRREAEKRVTFNHILTQLIYEVESCADEKPCPKCNEIEVFILSLSPNARSLLARCKHCQHEYRIKMEPVDPQKVISLFNSFIERRDSFSDTRNALPIWQMKIIQRRTTNQRSPIPSDVKKAVWKRDGGKCVNCGSEVDLEYDHIIPVAKGGSSTVQNIQILCKTCNRKKHASIS